MLANDTLIMCHSANQAKHYRNGVGILVTILQKNAMDFVPFSDRTMLLKK